MMPSNAAERVFDQVYSTPIPILYCIIPVYAATQPDYMINSQKAKGSDYVTRMSACTCGPVIYFPYSHCFATPTEVHMSKRSLILHLWLSYKRHLQVCAGQQHNSMQLCIMKTTLLFCLLAAGASIALALYKSSDFSEEGTGV